VQNKVAKSIYNGFHIQIHTINENHYNYIQETDENNGFYLPNQRWDVRIRSYPSLKPPEVAKWFLDTKLTSMVVPKTDHRKAMLNVECLKPRKILMRSNMFKLFSSVYHIHACVK
jgi:hypothetical protein